MIRAIRHAVWPTTAPPVCTAQWTQHSWDSFAEFARPTGYTGGIFDQAAYDDFKEDMRQLMHKGEVSPWLEV